MTTAVPAADADVQLDYVGSVSNAAKVIAALYRGEKRLVEELGARLRELGVAAQLIHASLSLDERRRSELAFVEGRDCVIVSTSALELGLDIGDLDRVIQINAPLSVAAFLQRLGRSGRRPETRRNCLFLALREDDLLVAAGLLLAWSRGFVEPVAAPPSPRHITAQQLLALCLQEGQVGERTWAGYRLKATLGNVADEAQRVDDLDHARAVLTRADAVMAARRAAASTNQCPRQRHESDAGTGTSRSPYRRSNAAAASRRRRP